MEEFSQLVCSTLDGAPPPDLSLSLHNRPLTRTRSTLNLHPGTTASDHMHSGTRGERRRTRTNSFPQSFFDLSPDDARTKGATAHASHNAGTSAPLSFFDDDLKPPLDRRLSRSLTPTPAFSAFFSRPFKLGASAPHVQNAVQPLRRALSPLPTPVTTPFGEMVDADYFALASGDFVFPRPPPFRPAVSLDALDPRSGQESAISEVSSFNPQAECSWRPSIDSLSSPTDTMPILSPPPPIPELRETRRGSATSNITTHSKASIASRLRSLPFSRSMPKLSLAFGFKSGSGGVSDATVPPLPPLPASAVSESFYLPENVRSAFQLSDSAERAAKAKRPRRRNSPERKDDTKRSKSKPKPARLAVDHIQPRRSTSVPSFRESVNLANLDIEEQLNAAEMGRVLTPEPDPFAKGEIEFMDPFARSPPHSARPNLGISVSTANLHDFGAYDIPLPPTPVSPFSRAESRVEQYAASVHVEYAGPNYASAPVGQYAMEAGCAEPFDGAEQYGDAYQMPYPPTHYRFPPSPPKTTPHKSRESRAGESFLPSPSPTRTKSLPEPQMGAGPSPSRDAGKGSSRPTAAQRAGLDKAILAYPTPVLDDDDDAADPIDPRPPRAMSPFLADSRGLLWHRPSSRAAPTHPLPAPPRVSEWGILTPEMEAAGASTGGTPKARKVRRGIPTFETPEKGKGLRAFGSVEAFGQRGVGLGFNDIEEESGPSTPTPKMHAMEMDVDVDVDATPGPARRSPGKAPSSPASFRMATYVPETSSPTRKRRTRSNNGNINHESASAPCSPSAPRSSPHRNHEPSSPSSIASSTSGRKLAVRRLRSQVSLASSPSLSEFPRPPSGFGGVLGYGGGGGVVPLSAPPTLDAPFAQMQAQLQARLDGASVAQTRPDARVRTGAPSATQRRSDVRSAAQTSNTPSQTRLDVRPVSQRSGVLSATLARSIMPGAQAHTEASVARPSMDMDRPAAQPRAGKIRMEEEDQDGKSRGRPGSPFPFASSGRDYVSALFTGRLADDATPMPSPVGESSRCPSVEDNDTTFGRRAGNERKMSFPFEGGRQRGLGELDLMFTSRPRTADTEVEDDCGGSVLFTDPWMQSRRSSVTTESRRSGSRRSSVGSGKRSEDSCESIGRMCMEMEMEMEDGMGIGMLEEHVLEEDSGVFGVREDSEVLGIEMEGLMPVAEEMESPVLSTPTLDDVMQLRQPPTLSGESDFLLVPSRRGSVASCATSSSATSTTRRSSSSSSSIADALRRLHGSFSSVASPDAPGRLSIATTSSRRSPSPSPALEVRPLDIRRSHSADAQHSPSSSHVSPVLEKTLPLRITTRLDSKSSPSLASPTPSGASPTLGSKSRRVSPLSEAKPLPPTPPTPSLALDGMDLPETPTRGSRVKEIARRFQKLGGVTRGLSPSKAELPAPGRGRSDSVLSKRSTYFSARSCSSDEERDVVAQKSDMEAVQEGEEVVDETLSPEPIFPGAFTP